MRTGSFGVPLLFLIGCVAPITSGTESDLSPDAGAAGDGSAALTTAPSEYDTEVLAVMMTYKGNTFTKINSTAYTSTLGAFEINVYAYGDVSGYQSIHPETDRATAMTIGVGTVIVREVLDASGNIDKLTAIAKAPAGYDATLGDWWFGETDATGIVMPDTSGSLQVGKVTACHGCHVPRANEDYLFGVPAAEMKGSGGGGGGGGGGHH